MKTRKKAVREVSKTIKGKGVVDWYDKNSGYGVIRREGAEDIFVYSSSLENRKYLTPGKKVRFTATIKPSGIDADKVTEL